MAGPEVLATPLCDQPPRPVGSPSDKGGSIPLDTIRHRSSGSEGQGKLSGDGTVDSASLEAESKSLLLLMNLIIKTMHKVLK